jgi:hypothetical protein
MFYQQLFMNNASSPGVGKYEVASSFGKQNQSTTKNLPSFSFSHSNRDQRAKVRTFLTSSIKCTGCESEEG